jgi:hypothetical protein
VVSPLRYGSLLAASSHIGLKHACTAVAMQVRCVGVYRFPDLKQEAALIVQLDYQGMAILFDR